jgi:inner membrane transporter RhtA
MTSTAPDRTGTPAPPAAPGVDPRARLTGVALMCASGLSCQFGAATATLAFPALGPAGVVAIRQWVAGIVLLAVGRPKVLTFTWRQWWPVLSLAAVFAIMNLSLYIAIDRIGLGLAIALEFLGPLAVALAASRRRIDLSCALVAGAAVVVLTRPQPTTDYAGIGLGLLAATCWAAYIQLNRVIGRRLPGAEGPAAAAGLSAVLYVPVGIWVLSSHTLSVRAIGYAAVAGVLSSAIPFMADVLALRRVPAAFFGVFMSVNPVLAALIGLGLLGQPLEWQEWLAICAIVTANAVSVGTAARTARNAGASHRAPVAGRTGAAGPADAGPASPGRTRPAAPPGQPVAAARAAAGTTAVGRPRRPRGRSVIAAVPSALPHDDPLLARRDAPAPGRGAGEPRRLLPVRPAGAAPGESPLPAPGDTWRI